MFAIESIKHVEQAIENETFQAKREYGDNYNSLHEGYAILKEEVEEAKENMEEFKRLMHILWLSVRGKPIENVKHYSNKKHVAFIKKTAIKLAMEAIQVAAVCNKLEDSIDKEFKYDNK